MRVEVVVGGGGGLKWDMCVYLPTWHNGIADDGSKKQIVLLQYKHVNYNL